MNRTVDRHADEWRGGRGSIFTRTPKHLAPALHVSPRNRQLVPEKIADKCRRGVPPGAGAFLSELVDRIRGGSRVPPALRRVTTVLTRWLRKERARDAWAGVPVGFLTRNTDR